MLGLPPRPRRSLALCRADQRRPRASTGCSRSPTCGPRSCSCWSGRKATAPIERAAARRHNVRVAPGPTPAALPAWLARGRRAGHSAARARRSSGSGNCVLPMKLFAYLAAGRPILAPGLARHRRAARRRRDRLAGPARPARRGGRRARPPARRRRRSRNAAERRGAAPVRRADLGSPRGTRSRLPRQRLAEVADRAARSAFANTSTVSPIERADRRRRPGADRRRAT